MKTHLKPTCASVVLWVTQPSSMETSLVLLNLICFILFLCLLKKQSDISIVLTVKGETII